MRNRENISFIEYCIGFLLLKKNKNKTKRDKTKHTHKKKTKTKNKTKTKKQKKNDKNSTAEMNIGMLISIFTADCFFPETILN